MLSVAAHLPNAILPTPPAQNWSCRQAARLSAGPAIPSTRHPEYWSSTSHPGPFIFGGLRTPPTDDMSTALHQPPLGHYDSRSMSAFPPMLSQAERTKAVPDTLYSQQARYHYPQGQSYADTQSRPAVVGQPPRNPEPRSQLAVPLPHSGQASQPQPQIRLPNGQPSRTSTPGSAGTYSQQRKASEGLSSSLTGQSSEIPEFISARGGSLPDLVAQVSSPWFC